MFSPIVAANVCGCIQAMESAEIKPSTSLALCSDKLNVCFAFINRKLIQNLSSWVFLLIVYHEFSAYIFVKQIPEIIGLAD